MKKILTTILAAALGLGAWANPVAKVGTTEYETIDEAIAAWGPGKTLTLLADVTYGQTVIVEVNATKSTQNWTLDLGNYRWTANGCNAFQLYAAGGTVMNQNYGLKVYANEAGGITATGKYCIECKYDTSTAGYRPRLEIHGGVYNGSYVVYYQSLTWNSSSVSNGPSTWFYTSNDGAEPVFNGNFALAKCPVTINAGYFNGTSFNTYPVASTADTYLQGGHFKTWSAFPSASNNKGIKYGNHRILVKSDGSIDVTNGAPTTFEASTTSYTTFLTGNRKYNGSSSSYYPGLIYFESANYAIKNYIIPIVLSSGVKATESKTISTSGTMTVDTTASGASYTGNITLSNSNAKFVVKFNDGTGTDAGYYGSVTAASGKYIHLEETTESGVVTRTYSVKSNSSSGQAKIGDLYYDTVYDAFYAVDGNTENKTITLLKDVSNAGILTNGKAVNEAGKTVVTFDLNGHSFQLQSAGTGNDADYTLTVIDSSEGKTGEVLNTTFSLMKIALTGNGDYSGKYTLKVQGGTWHFNPSAVTYDGKTYDLVDVGYSAIDNPNGTWTVGQVVIETGDLQPSAPVAADATEATYTVSTTVKVDGNVVSSTASQTVNVSVPSSDIGGTTLSSVKLDSVITAAIEAQGTDASAVTDIEILVNAVDTNTVNEAIVYEVKPEAVVTVTQGGVSTQSEPIELSNDDLAPGASFTVLLDVTPLGAEAGDSVKVAHESDDPAYATETYFVQAFAGDDGKVYVRVTVSHFSTFTLSLLSTQPVTTSVQSVNLFGAVKVEGVASNMFVAVPFDGFDGGARQAKDVVHPAGLANDTKMYVYDPSQDKYDVFKTSDGAWTQASKVTIGASDTVSVDNPSLEREVKSGSGVIVERTDKTQALYLYGQIPTNTSVTITTESALVSVPSTNALEAVDLNALDWTGVTSSTCNTAGTRLSSNGGKDMIKFRSPDGKTVSYYYFGGKWGPNYRPSSWDGKATVPAGTAFWYTKKEGTATTVTVKW